LTAEIIDIAALREANLITSVIRRVKIMLSGDVSKPLTLKGLRVTAGARSAIEAAGGKIIEVVIDKNVGKNGKKLPKKAGSKD